MALLEDALGGWGSGLIVGVGAAVVGPALLAVAGFPVRPIAKAVVRGALVVADAVTQIVSEASEQLYDLVAEVRAESAASGHGSGSGKARSAAAHR